MGRVLHIEVGEDGVALITLNKPPVNSLDNSGSESVMYQLKGSFFEAHLRPDVKAIVIIEPACQFTQAEASRALAYLLSDVNTAESVLGKPHALSYLLHFAASIHVNDAVESLMKGLEIKMVMTEAACKDLEFECLEE